MYPARSTTLLPEGRGQGSGLETNIGLLDCSVPSAVRKDNSEQEEEMRDDGKVQIAKGSERLRLSLNNLLFEVSLPIALKMEEALQ